MKGKTNRNNNQAPPQEFIDEVKKLSSDNCHITFPADKDTKDKIADIVSSAEAEVKKLSKQFTSTFLVISSNDDEVSYIKSGQLFQRIWLMAKQRGISMSPLSAAIQSGENSKKLQEILGTKHQSFILSRLGYSKEEASS